MNPLLPIMMDTPHGRLWKWFLRRLIKEGNTFTSTPCDNCQENIVMLKQRLWVVGILQQASGLEEL